jgi:hypothetical protein
MLNPRTTTLSFLSLPLSSSHTPTQLSLSHLGAWVLEHRQRLERRPVHDGHLVPITQLVGAPGADRNVVVAPEGGK